MVSSQVELLLTPVYEPKTSPSAGQGTYAGGLFTEGADLEVSNTAGYAWKYMYTIPTDDVLRFLSTNFLPINLPTESTRDTVAQAAVDGAIDVVLVEDAGSGLPNGTHYAPVNGDGQLAGGCLLYTSPSPRDLSTSRMPSSA